MHKAYHSPLPLERGWGVRLVGVVVEAGRGVVEAGRGVLLGLVARCGCGRFHLFPFNARIILYE